MDATHFNDIFERQAGPLRLWARQWLDPAAADDAAQEAFVRLLGQTSPPEDAAAWLFTVTRRLATDQLRRRKVRTDALPKVVTEDFCPSDSLEAADAVAALTVLPERQRQVVIARHWGGLGFAAIAELTNTSLATAHTDYTTALSTLRERLDP